MASSFPASSRGPFPETVQVNSRSSMSVWPVANSDTLMSPFTAFKVSPSRAPSFSHASHFSFRVRSNKASILSFLRFEMLQSPLHSFSSWIFTVYTGPSTLSPQRSSDSRCLAYVVIDRSSQCHELTLQPSGLSATSHLESPSPHLAMARRTRRQGSDRLACHGAVERQRDCVGEQNPLGAGRLLYMMEETGGTASCRVHVCSHCPSRVSRARTLPSAGR
mmetsp:Transcript_14360/g.40569  ORF Transcript_14360/g.40569 Transcript_14360/m.40569 type:complete len:220 (+) Transcript_14360:220-879(+)